MTSCPRVLLPAAAAILAAVLALLVQPGNAQYGFMPPFPYGGSFQDVPPFMPNMPTGPPNVTCEQLRCARGTCSINSSSTHTGSSYSYNYSYSFSGCQCNQGWSRPPTSMMMPLPFLPCVLPNCTINNCSNSVPEPNPPADRIDYTNPCSWAYCGGGQCDKKTNYTYSCNCRPGYKNLFSDPTFPCFSDCSLSTECRNQGVGFLPLKSDGQSGGGGSGSNGGGSGSSGGSSSSAGGANTAISNSFLCLLIIATALAAIIIA